MDEKQLRKTVSGLLVEACGSKDVLADNIDLLESGLLDSFALITLLDDLEELGIVIQPTRVDRNAFRSLDGILALCQSALQES